VTVDRAALALAFIVGGLAALLGWLWLAERIADALPPRVRRQVLGVLWTTPALALVGVYLVWPLGNTVVLSLRDAQSRAWRGLDNYRYLAVDPQAGAALENNLLWLGLLTFGCLGVGLLMATLADQVRYEAWAKAAVVAPTAIPFVAGAVIWRFMYQYQPPGFPQTGTLNAVWVGLTGHDPIAFLVDSRTNNSALILVGVWMTTGFATIILSAALKGVPSELREAARIDGATGWQTFRYVLLPQVRPAIVVTATLLAISAFKAFDVVYVMTNGNFATDVLANLMYRQLFIDQDYGRASAIAVLLAVAAIPVLVINARAARREEV
jgi:alpha-glucoside transport system permease protein